jgi:hypothetical protein
VSEGHASLEGSADSGGATRDSADVVVVCGTNGPWGRPHGPMEIRVV